MSMREDQLDYLIQLYVTNGSPCPPAVTRQLVAEVKRLRAVEKAAKALHDQVAWWVSSKLAIGNSIVQANNDLKRLLDAGKQGD